MLFMLLILGIVAAFFFLKFKRTKKKESDPVTNRYRSYPKKPRATTPSAAVRSRPNRYHRQNNQREAELSYKENPPEPIIEAPVKQAPVKQAPLPSSATIEDPDEVLGLKEAAPVSQKPSTPQARQMTLQAAPLPAPIITFNVMALEDRPFMGYELLQAILSVGMRYGQHQIFHRHQEKTGRGNVLFSLASMTRPGYFDLPNMGSFSTKGLSLFFKADSVEDPIAVYELMLQTAGQLVEDLGGHVLDERRELLTPAKVVAQRKQLHQYIESHENQNLFEETTEG